MSSSTSSQPQPSGPPPTFQEIADAVKSATPEQLAAMEAALGAKTGMSGRSMGSSVAVDDENDPAQAAVRVREEERTPSMRRLISASKNLSEAVEMEVEDIESAKLVVGAFYDANVLSVPRALIAKHLEALPSRRPDEMQRVSCESFEAFIHHAASLRVLHGQFSPTWTASYAEDLLMHFSENENGWRRAESIDLLNLSDFIVALLSCEA